MEFFFEEEKSIKYLHSAVGVFNNHYYFGFNIYSRKKRFNKKEEKFYYEYKDNLCLVNSENDYIDPLEIEKSENYKIKGNLFMNESRWELSHMKSYLADNMYDISSEKMFNDIKDKYVEYIDFIDEDYYELLTLWDIGTYFFTLFHSYPYIHLHGLKNTGKSKVMQLSANMAFNAQVVSGMTNATLFRIVEQNRPALYIDEFELVHGKESKEDKEFEGMLNNGYKKGLKVPRLEQDGKTFTPRFFEVYCPKMVANISGLKGALPSRCIKIVMQRAMKEDPRGDLYPVDNNPIWKHIRNDLYVYTLKNWEQVKFKYDNLKKEFDITNRDWELWKPIITMAKHIDEELYKRIGLFAEKFSKKTQMEEEMTDSWDYTLLNVLDQLVEEDRYYYVKSEICSRLDNEFIESQSNEKVFYKKSRPSPEWVGRTLRKFGVSDYKRDKKGTMYFLTRVKLSELIQRLQIKSLMKD
jgi:hypothetical protein|tara:strand:- start:1334 stop:2734 length:1401 start_codon:yes stop_codon:yes gene_type:complete